MKKLVVLVCALIALNVSAQDSLYVRKAINTLTSRQLWGRGYTNNGMAKAAGFISTEYARIGLFPMGSRFEQVFRYPVNTFPGIMLLEINGKKLIPGKDFIISNESKGMFKQTDLVKIDSLHFQSGSDLIIELKDKLTWSVASQVVDVTKIEVSRKNFTEVPKVVNVNIKNQFLEKFEAANICGLVKGTKYPDSILMITAHYDHLGGIGNDTYFPGANDNAAGVATLLSLAKFYAANPQPYSIGFICFAGEEAGLLGSKFFVENPLMELSKIKFLINLDLVGTGESGMTVVNATIYPEAFKKLNFINDQYHYISKINPRGKAANSDHYFFTEAGVPAFFIYTQGGPQAYHDIYDQPQNLPLTAYNNLFKLIVAFQKAIVH